MGISQDSSALMSLEKRAFFDIYKKNHFNDIRQERRIKQRIREVMVDYNSRMDRLGLQKISDRIYRESRRYDYDPFLLTALIVTESSFHRQAKSNRGALGLMQIRLNTGASLAPEANISWKGQRTLFDPEHNIALGALYLNKLRKRFKDMHLALEAYNHGPSQLSRYLRQGKIPRSYSRKVIRIYNQIRSNQI